MSKRYLAIALCGAALICFIAPWFALVAGGHTIIRFTGIELVNGTTFRSESPAAYLGTFGQQPVSQAAAFCGLMAFLCAIPLRRLAGWAASFFGCLAAVCQIATGVLFPNLLRLRTGPGMEITRQSGYYLAVILFLAGAVCAAPGADDARHRQ